MSEESKKCPMCGEEILAIAKKCKHCGEMLDGTQGSSPPGGLDKLLNKNKKQGMMNKNLSPKASLSIVGGIILSIVVLAMVAPDRSKSSGSHSKDSSIYTCEIHNIRSCNGGWLTGGAFDCLFTNKSKVAYNPNQLSAWHYDSKGILINEGFIYDTSSVSPNNTVHMKMNVPSDTKETVICSMNPKSGFLDRSSWKAIN